MWETQGASLGWKITWRREWQPTPVFLPGEFLGQRSLVGYSPWGCKESDMTEWLTLSYTILGLGFTFWRMVFLETKVTISKLCISAPQYNCGHGFYKYVLNEYVIKNQKAKIIFNRKTLDKFLLNSAHFLLQTELCLLKIYTLKS